MSSNILIVGAGAIGAFYGALLAKQGAGVSVVCRSDYEQVTRHGFHIDSCDLGSWAFKPKQVLKSTTEYTDTADYVILCSKVVAGIDRIGLIRDAVSPNTVIVFIQNGVEIEQPIAAAFHDHEIISGLAFICSNRVAPGKISHLAYGRLVLGNFPGGASDKVMHLCQLFRQAGIACHATEDIVTARWQKNVWNAPFNPLSVLSGGLSTRDILNTREDFVRNIMQDVCNVAAATGHALPEDIIDVNIESTRVMPPYKTSMLLDYENGLPMETEVILGNAVRAGRRCAVACHYLESVYAMLQLKEFYLRQKNNQVNL